MSITHADGRSPEMRRMDALEKRIRWLEVLAGVDQQRDYPAVREEAAALAALPTAPEQDGDER